MDALAGGACAILSAAIWAFSSTWLTAPVRTFGGRATNLFKSVVAAGMFGAAVLIWLGPGALALPPALWLRFAASGILGLAIADTAYLSALRHVGPTLTAIAYQTSGIFTCVLGVSFMGESLSWKEIVAIALVIGGVLLALLDDRPAHVEPGHLARGAGLAIFAAAFHAVGLVQNKAAFNELVAFDGSTGLRAATIAGFARMSSASAALLAFGFATRSLARQTRVLRERAGWRATFLPALAGSFVAMIAMQVSLTLLKAGVASVLLSMTPIFTIPVAWWILGDAHRPTWRAGAGATIAIVGACLLSSGGAS